MHGKITNESDFRRCEAVANKSQQKNCEGVMFYKLSYETSLEAGDSEFNLCPLFEENKMCTSYIIIYSLQIKNI